jgi:hypothetical protein
MAQIKSAMLRAGLYTAVVIIDVTALIHVCTAMHYLIVTDIAGSQQKNSLFLPKNLALSR